MAIHFKIKGSDNTRIIYESSKMSLITDLITYCFITFGFIGFYLNHNYFGDSFICSFVCGFIAISGFFLFGKTKSKTLTKQELKDYIDKL
jgi:hypothetical protein